MPKKRNELFDWIKAIIIALIVAFIIRAFIISPIIVDGPSMQPTLNDRDQMIVNKFNYHFSDPNRFDIVIFHATEEKDYIKRVIGIPGDYVEVKEGELYINNEKAEEYFLPDDEAFATTDFKLESLPGNYEVIPEGKVLVLGDNRSNSTDSRSIGLVDIDEIVGKASLVYWPFDRVQFVK